MLDSYRCWNCEKGMMERQLVTYQTDLSNDRFIRVENVIMDVCNVCGEQGFSQTTVEQIEQAIEKKYPGYYDLPENKDESDTESLESFLEDFPHDSM